MLSVSSVKNAGKAGAYYTNEDNYYFLGEQSTEWYGTGAENLGLEGPVNRDTFVAVLEGQLPDGTDMRRMEGGVNKHRPGYDLTFSAPKSVSVLALVTGDTFLVDAHKEAVRRTLDEVEKLATTRTMTDGITEMEKTGNLVIATFMHDTSRNLEPQMHTHAVVANATLSQNGWKTLSTDINGKQGFTDVVWNEQVSIGALYRGHFRSIIEPAGYQTEDTGPRGEWDITGVPVKPFSSRRQDILDLVGDNATAKQKSMAALDSRQAKHFEDPETLREHWQTVLKDTGFDVQTFREALAERRQQRETESAGEEKKVATPSLLDGAVREAIERLSSKSVRVTYDDVMTSVLNHVPVSEGVYGQARSAIDNAIGRGQLIAVDKNQTLFTTAAHVRDEARLSQLAAGLAEKRGGLTAPADERGVLAQVADADRAVSLIDVRGGTQFISDLNRSIMAMASESRRPLIVVVADGAARKPQLATFGDKPGVQLMTAEEMKSAELPARPLVLVAESERFNTSGLHDVLKAAVQHDGTTLVTDTHARRTAGFASEVLSAAGVRQFTATPKTENVRVTMVQKDTVEDRLSVAARYYAQEKAQGRVVSLQAGNARTRDQLTTRTREILADEGQLGRVLGEATVRVPVWLDASNRNDRSVYRAGMVLEHHEGQGQKSVFTIAGVSERHNLLTLKDEKGQTQGVSISSIDSHYRLYREKKLELREGEQLRATADLGSRAVSGERLTVTGVKEGRWLFKDTITMENAKGERIRLDRNAPLYADYAYAESFGATRRTEGSVVAVLAGKEVNDATVNMLRRSGSDVIAFTPLDEATIGRRLEENRPVVSVTQGIKSLAGQSELTDALRELESRKMSQPERAMRLAIEKATGTDVTFTGVRALAGVINTDRSITPARAQEELSRLVQRGEIFELSGDQGAAGNYISRENFENEVSILRHVAEGKNSVKPLLAGGLSEEKAAGLTDGQREAGNLILTTRDRFTAIQGYAGVGKTTQFRTVAAALTAAENRPDIRGLAPTHRAVSELSEAGIPAQTIASFLSESSQWQAAGQARDFRNTVFVIDESSMNGNAQMASLMNVIAESGGRAVLSGDRDQLKSLESGAPFALALERSAADVAVMKEIVRQIPALKPAVEAVIAGNVREAVRISAETSPLSVPRQPDAYVPESSAMDGSSLAPAGPAGAGVEAEKPDLIGMIADDYVGRTPEARDNTLIVTELNADREAINSAVHERLQAQGALGDGVTVPLLVRVNNSNADLGRQTFWEAQAGNVVRRGEQYYRVGETDAESGVVRMTGLGGSADRWIRPAELRKEEVAVFREVEREISPGEKIRLTTTDRDRNLRASDTGVVTGITEEGKITLDTGDRQLSFDPTGLYADRHMDYGYAVTTYSSQGASVKYLIGLFGEEGARKMMAALDSTYVQLSRAKEHVQTYFDNLSGWAARVESKSGRRQTVHDVLMRAEDVRAGREMQAWDKSLPVSGTRLADRVDQDLTADARFMAGKTPEMLWPVINEHGRQRGNWHVPVSPSSGEVNFSAAHYEGAADGSRIVLQRGEKRGKVLEAADVAEALQLMKDNPDSPVVFSADHSERSGDKGVPAEAATVTSGGEELDRREAEALEKAIKAAQGQEEKEPEPAVQDDARSAPADRESEHEAALAAALEELLEEEAFDYRDYDLSPEREDRTAMMNDEVNVMRHERSEPEPEFGHKPQKNLE
ncbi:conjugative transfer relaxase/helicase TraI [Candidatus Pantoea deserta]|uniref:Conjugative transfer relaxase/helicase TraI n=1 Tax=Candidatus Pantoea deserta TaxID=1869313 RepID=A0A3N4NGL7_9GAMM|nr:conjugative transfer relaxase/helicase TraI [Pantoea deserta]RPD93467.1 conjugative transfer relaxase/helicase TraI [Pantoea deserta]